MKRFSLEPRAAFEPPSDYVGDGGGGASKSKKLLLVGGIGCGVILLVIGILFAAGAFKAVSCCNQAQEFAQNSAKAQEFALDFGQAVQMGEFARAHGMTSQAYRAENDLATFEAAFEPYSGYLDANPRVFNIRAGSANGEQPQSLDDLGKGWVIVVQYATPEGNEQFLVELDVRPEGEGKFVIDGVRAETRARSLSAEPPAREVLEVHDDLAAGNYEMAYGRMAPPFRQETDMNAFKGFLADTDGIMTSNDVEIQSVDYSSPQSATVMATVTANDGRRAIVQYELQTPLPNLPSWQIVAMSPRVTSNAPGGSPEQPEVTIDAGSADADVVAP